MCRAVSWIDEHGRAFVVGCAVCTGPAHLGPFPVGIALVSGVSHCPFSFFLRLKAGCRSNRVCLSGEERDGEGGGKSMALARAGRPSAADAHLGVGCRAWRTTRGRLFSFGNDRAAALGVPRAGAPPGEGRGARCVTPRPSGSGDRWSMWTNCRES